MNGATQTPLTQICGSVVTLGSALITLAVAAGANPWLLPLLTLAGILQVILALGTLQGKPFPAWTVTSGSLLPATIWLVAVTTGNPSTQTIPLIPMLLGVGLAIMGCATLLFQTRQTSGSQTARQLPPLLTLFTVAATCLLVSAVTTFALAGTLAGESAVSHGEHHLEEEIHDLH